MNPNPNQGPNQGPNPNELDDERLAAAIRGTLQRKGDAVVAGGDGLDRIRAAIDAGGGDRRAARPGSGRPRFWLVTAAAATLVLTFGVVGSLTRPGGTDLQTVGRGSPGTAPGSTSAATSAATSAGIPVYYPGKVGQTYLLFREFHPWPAGGAADALARVQAAVTQAMSLPPNDPDYLVLWSRYAGADVALVGDQIVVTLNEAAAGGSSIAGPGADVIDLQQLIWTATAAAASGGATAPSTVVIRAEGPTPERFGSISLAQPFRRGGPPGSGDPRAPVWIDSLGQDAAVPTGPLTVTGQGTGSTTGVRWRLSLAGAVVASGSVRPTAVGGGPLGAGVRGVWSLTVNLAAVGRYHLDVTQDASGGAAGGSDSKDFVAR